MNCLHFHARSLMLCASVWLPDKGLPCGLLLPNYFDTFNCKPSFSKTISYCPVQQMYCVIFSSLINLRTIGVVRIHYQDTFRATIVIVMQCIENC